MGEGGGEGVIELNSFLHGMNSLQEFAQRLDASGEASRVQVLAEPHAGFNRRVFSAEVRVYLHGGGVLTWGVWIYNEMRHAGDPVVEQTLLLQTPEGERQVIHAIAKSYICGQDAAGAFAKACQTLPSLRPPDGWMLNYPQEKRDE